MKENLVNIKNIIGQGFLPIEGKSVIDINGLSSHVKNLLVWSNLRVFTNFS
jgi:hypothetical protein